MHHVGLLKSPVRLGWAASKRVSDSLILARRERKPLNRKKSVEVLFLDPSLQADVDTSYLPDEELQEALQYQDHEVQKEKLLSRLCIRFTLASYMGVEPNVRRSI